MKGINMFSRIGLSGFWLVLGILALGGVFIGTQSYFTTNAGYNYVVENQWTGNLSVIAVPGVHAKVPFFTNVYSYKQVATINFASKGSNGNFTRNLGKITVRFADSYDGHIPATFRYRLPAGEDAMLALHKEFRSFGNFADALLVKNSQDVAIVTATQYAGEEFFLGGLNEYKVQLGDQLKNGLYQTVRRQVEVVANETAAVTSKNSNANKLEKKAQMVWKNVVLYDGFGDKKVARRLENPLEQYGVTLSQVTVGNPSADERLNKLLITKKDLVGKRIAAIQGIETAQAEARRAQQDEEIKKVRAIQVAQREKEVAVVAAQQLVEVAQQDKRLAEVRVNKVKSVAVIDKEKELAIAEADRDIQKAAAQAAKFEAEAIKSVGLAQAEVDTAKLAAKQSAKDIYLAEMELEKAKVMYPVLENVRIDMPDFFVAGANGGAAPTSLDVFTSLGALNQLQGRKAEGKVK